MEQFAFEDGEEALARGLIEAISDRDRGPHAGLVATLAEGDRGVLAAESEITAQPI